MDQIQKIIPITKAKKDLLDIVKEITAEDSTIAVTKNGVPVTVMMTPERYEGLLETIEILASPDIVKSLAASEKDFRAGRAFSHKEVWPD